MTTAVRAGSGRHVGVTGLAVMGQNLARNIAGHGFPLAVHNRTTARVDELLDAHGDEGDFVGAHSVEELVGSLEQPRAVIIMVKAGPPVDAVIDELRPHLQPGDVVIDGGNSDFTDTERRYDELAGAGLEFLGCGISGGEEGALHGPSLMPGGSPAAYDVVVELLTAIAAQVDGTPCCTYIGAGGAGHYVKMVHNGIEYADMQLIAEAYDVLHTGLGLSNDVMADIFEAWNEGDLDSFLIGITARILRCHDDLVGAEASPAPPTRRERHLIDLVVDSAGQKGTGRLTAIDALHLGSPSTVIAEAVAARSLSSLRDERMHASSILPARQPPGFTITVDELRDALYAAKVIAYAQGFDQLRRGGEDHGWDLRLDDLATIWRGGCIIRARFLDRVREAAAHDRASTNLTTVPYFRDALAHTLPGLRSVVAQAVLNGVPMAATSAALAWFDSYRRARLPANLIQAQRDLFGAHTYERVDRVGPFHSRWT